MEYLTKCVYLSYFLSTKIYVFINRENQKVSRHLLVNILQTFTTQAIIALHKIIKYCKA